MIAVRATVSQYNPPYIFYTDDRIPEFFSIKSGGSAIHDLALQMEGYLVSGMNCKSLRTRSDARIPTYIFL